MRLFNRDLRLQDVTVVYFTALAALMVILVASYQAPPVPVDLPSVASGPSGALPRLPPLPMPFRMPLDPLGEVYLAWNISYATQEIYMELRVADLHQGVLLGMSDQGELTNADLVVLWNTGSKSYFGVGHFLPVNIKFTGFKKAIFLHICGLCEGPADFYDCMLINDVIKSLIKNHSNCTNDLSSSGNR